MSPEETAENIVAQVEIFNGPYSEPVFANPNQIRLLIRDAIRGATAVAQKGEFAPKQSEKTLEERVATLEADIVSLLKMRQYERDSDAKHTWYIEGQRAMSDQESLIHQVTGDMVTAMVSSGQSPDEENFIERVLERLDWLEAKRQEAARHLRKILAEDHHF
ncbi:MAG: hypothetical protein JWN14_4555 [Chthonomonadales bacterium]|nr:hypothetical protein [Chthonomonadales bacterium]